MTVYRLPPLELGSLSLDLNVPANKPLFDVVTDFAMFGAITFETLVIAALFVFRTRYPAESYALPYRCPGYPVVPALYVLIMACVLGNMFASPETRTEPLVGVGFIVVGALVYAAVYARRGR